MHKNPVQILFEMLKGGKEPGPVDLGGTKQRSSYHYTAGKGSGTFKRNRRRELKASRRRKMKPKDK